MKKILMLLSMLNIYTNTATMDNKPSKQQINTPQSKNKQKSPFRTLSYPAEFTDFITQQKKPINYYGKNKRRQLSTKKNMYEEVFDLRTQAAMVNEPFYKLIQEREKEKKPYFFAAILVDEKIKNKKTNLVEERFGRHFHDAAYLIGWIFDKYFDRKSGKKDPVTGQAILIPIYFFKVNKLDGPVTFFASEMDLLQDSDKAQFVFSLIKSEIAQPTDLFNLAYAYHHGKGTYENTEKAKKYYEMCIKDDENFVCAIIGLGNLFLEQGNYAKAEQQYLLAAQKNDINAQLNLIYLFGIKQSTQTIDDVKAWCINATQYKEYMYHYKEKHPICWNTITQIMQELELEVPTLHSPTNDTINDTEMEMYSHASVFYELSSDYENNDFSSDSESESDEMEEGNDINETEHSLNMLADIALEQNGEQHLVHSESQNTLLQDNEWQEIDELEEEIQSNTKS